jgi:hypothetical protein
MHVFLGQSGPTVDLIEKLQLFVIPAGSAQLAPPLLLPGNIKAIEGATHEDDNRDDVQEGAGT